MHPALKKYLEGKIALSTQQEELVSNRFTRRLTKRHELLVEKGAIAKHLYFVCKGCLRIFLTNEDGRESTRYLIVAGQMGTALPSFILNQPSVASIQSLGVARC